ncbi:MAG: hypothetical protein K2L97_01750 [Muribaculaceae bacterium]|nr:hypothetical protein [Muribaculaceae bacterium]
MKRVSIVAVLTALGLLLCASNASAFKIPGKKDPKPKVNYTEWISIQDLPSEEDGIAQYYPETETTEGKAVIKGNVKINGLSARQIFLATMIYATENFDIDNNEGILAVDYDKYEFSALYKTTVGANNREATYTRFIKVKALDGGFDFETGDIAVRYREKGLIPRTLEMENLHPESNTRHGELVMELVHLNAAYIDAMAKYAASRHDISSPNYATLINGKVTIGMLPDEVTILLGAPIEKRRSGEKHRWIYGNETVIIFENGKVSRIID